MMRWEASVTSSSMKIEQDLRWRRQSASKCQCWFAKRWRTRKTFKFTNDISLRENSVSILLSLPKSMFRIEKCFRWSQLIISRFLFIYSQRLLHITSLKWFLSINQRHETQLHSILCQYAFYLRLAQLQITFTANRIGESSQSQQRMQENIFSPCRLRK